MEQLEVANAVKQTPPTPESLRPGQAVCARYQEDGLWYRATIIRVNQDTATVSSIIQFPWLNAAGLVVVSLLVSDFFPTVVVVFNGVFIIVYPAFTGYGVLFIYIVSAAP